MDTPWDKTYKINRDLLLADKDGLFSRERFIQELSRWEKYLTFSPEILQQCHLNPEEKRSVERFMEVYGTPPYNQNGIYSSKKRQSYLHTNQLAWNLFTNITVNAIAEVFKNITDFETFDLEEFFTILGNHRYMMAKELGHGAESNSTEDYGKMCFLEETKISDYISKDPNTSGWHREADFIFSKINEQLSTDFDKYPPLFGEENFFYKRHTDGLKIEVDQLDSEITSVKLEYDSDFRPYLSRLKDSLKKAAQSETEQEVLHALGECSYLLYRIAPWVLGSSSIVDWICHGVAKSKEVVLGNRIEEPFSLDFMAFLTPDQKLYAEWFVLNAYEMPVPDELIAQETAEKMPIETQKYFSSDNRNTLFLATKVKDNEPDANVSNNLKPGG